MEIFNLVPDRIKFDRFWIEIKERNIWLIHLRYAAAAMLAGLTALLELLMAAGAGISAGTLPLWICSATILAYNVVFARAVRRQPAKWDPSAKFHGVLFALLQICTDFLALLAIIYFTGGVETPFYVFFVFHIIIGSLILPGRIVMMLLVAVVGTTLAAAIAELKGIIPHNGIDGLLPAPLYNNEIYVAVFFTFFSLTLFISIYLANSIARSLYQREYELTLAYSELEGAEREKSRYVRSVVHDLKTPIAAAGTYLNLMLDGSICIPAKEQIYPLERCQARLDGAIGLINDILYISQLKLSDEPAQTADVPLRELAEELFSEMNVLFHEKKIAFSIAGSDISYPCERKLMRLALSNLLSNAYKYTETGGRVEVGIASNREFVQISVADSGMGIPEGEIDKVFTDFYRSTLSKRRNIEGTGLGITIVKQIVERYSGRLEARSPSHLAEDGRPGTEFIIILPINKL